MLFDDVLDWLHQPTHVSLLAIGLAGVTLSIRYLMYGSIAERSPSHGDGAESSCDGGDGCE